MERTVTIERWLDAKDRPGVAAGVEQVFFTSSATQSFPDTAERERFRERWLGRFLSRWPEWAYVALDAEDGVAGYLIGCLDDPARTAVFNDIGYFEDLGALTARFPAQLHVNVAVSHRGHGLGAALVDRFAAEAEQAGTHGVHVVTLRGMRNVTFYERLGFSERGSIDWNGRELVFLGRTLDAG